MTGQPAGFESTEADRDVVERMLPERLRELPAGQLIALPGFQHFAAAVLAADWQCYPDSADRADKARLQRTLAGFPHGFRLWGKPGADGALTPLGYTGWHPIPREIFELLLTLPARAAAYGLELPVTALRADGENYLYLFNYSIAPILIGTSAPGRMMRSYAADLAAVRPKGMAAITVSAHGARIAARFGLQPTGEIEIKGKLDTVYAGRF
jgi:hypothetical protein